MLKVILKVSMQFVYISLLMTRYIVLQLLIVTKQISLHWNAWQVAIISLGVVVLFPIRSSSALDRIPRTSTRKY